VVRGKANYNTAVRFVFTKMIWVYKDSDDQSDDLKDVIKRQPYLLPYLLTYLIT